MEIVYLIILLEGVASAVLGIWLGFKFYQLRLLALEKSVDLQFTAIEAHVSKLKEIVLNAMKRDGINKRWRDNKENDEETLKELKDKPAEPVFPGFDMNSWMNGK